MQALHLFLAAMYATTAEWLTMLLVLLSAIVVAITAQDAEESMTPAEMIAHWGYAVESHEVATDDGYVLSMLRIPHGRASEAEADCHRPPILLIHGLFQDASAFVMNPAESSPGMILADAGFDVFLLNVRGTTYSQQHLNMTKHDGDFWKFTLDDMAKFDAPAAGTMVSFMMLSERPEYNAKVRAMFELAPAGTLHWIRGVLNVFLWLDNMLKGVFRTFHMLSVSFEFGLRSPGLLGGVARTLCGPATRKLCRDVQFLVLGPPGKTYNWTRSPVYLATLFSSTSTWNLLHWMQLGLRNTIEHFDAFPEDNLRRYGQTTALPYNLSNIDTDVYLFWSRNDWLTSPAETERALLPRMKRGVVKDTFEIPEYNHLDFVVATDVADRIFNKIVAIVRRREANACLQ